MFQDCWSKLAENISAFEVVHIWQFSQNEEPRFYLFILNDSQL